MERPPLLRALEAEEFQVNRTTTRRNQSKSPSQPTTVRVAIYTRKSTEEGLDQDFNSLDAQRQAIEAFVESQRGKGWLALPERYDDGGYSGATTDRPAFQRLLSDIETGLIDVVAVYRIDRLSRSLADFARILAIFEKHGVAFVSITQQFSTADSSGKLLMNILMSFAEFERAQIAERTRDKMAATRRRGQWTGGRPALGYDLINKKLVINTVEAERVREIFRLYADYGSLIAVAAEANRRGGKTKSYTTKVGQVLQGRAFDKHAVRRVVSSPLYVGKVSYAGELHEGEHDAIIDEETWAAAQKLLKQNGQSRNGNGCGNGNTILQGLVRCGVCGSAMVPHSTKKRGRRYTAYVCLSYQKQGASACPGSRISARQLEGAVVDRIRLIGRDPTLVSATSEAAKIAQADRKPDLVREQHQVEQDLRRLHSEKKNLLDAVAQGGAASGSLTDRLGETEQALSRLVNQAEELKADIRDIDDQVVEERELRDALAAFDELWNAMTTREQSRVLWLLIESVIYDGREGEVSIQFRPSGIRCLADQEKEKPSER